MSSVKIGHAAVSLCYTMRGAEKLQGRVSFSKNDGGGIKGRARISKMLIALKQARFDNGECCDDWRGGADSSSGGSQNEDKAAHGRILLSLGFWIIA